VFVVCRRGSQVRLDVRDSGIGIPGDELGKVFRAFHLRGAVSQSNRGPGGRSIMDGLSEP
jgi:signal transduction histidine kinase